MSYVFGIPITEQTLRASGEYPADYKITQKDLADYAFKSRNDDSREGAARKRVEDLKKSYGDGISAKCLIYNATGTSLKFIQYNDFHGSIYDGSYPTEILNGQWGAYLHVKGGWGPIFGTGAAGGVVYRGKTPSAYEECDFLFCWSIPKVGGSNRVYTEIREKDHYFHNSWDYIYSKRLEVSTRQSKDIGYGYESNTGIGDGTTVEAKAVFKLA